MKLNFTAEDKKSLIESMASGTIEVAYDDKKARYRSLSEIIDILSLIENAESRKKKSFSTRVCYSKGIF